MTVIEDFLEAALGRFITVQVGLTAWAGGLFAGDDRHIVIRMEDGLKLIAVDDITAIDVAKQAEIVAPENSLLRT